MQRLPLAHVQVSTGVVTQTEWVLGIQKGWELNCVAAASRKFRSHCLNTLAEAWPQTVVSTVVDNQAHLANRKVEYSVAVLASRRVFCRLLYFESQQTLKHGRIGGKFVRRELDLLTTSRLAQGQYHFNALLDSVLALECRRTAISWFELAVLLLAKEDRRPAKIV